MSLEDSTEKMAAWLTGAMVAWLAVGVFPPWIDRDDFAKHSKTALDMLEGGAFNPLHVYAFRDYCHYLSQRLEVKVPK